MTDLLKPVTRRTTLLVDHRIKARNRDRIAVTLHPDGFISFRAHKCRKEVRLPLSAVYLLALREEERQQRIEVKRRRVA